MAASSKPTGVHFALVFFALLSVLLAVATYMMGSELSNTNGKLQTETKNAQDATSALKTARDEINTLKGLIGIDLKDVGIGEDPGKGTVANKLIEDLATYGGEHVQPSPQQPKVVNTLMEMSAALKNRNAQVTQLESGMVAAEGRLTQETTNHQNRANELQQSQQGSEDQLKTLVQGRDELLAEKDAQIGEWRTNFQREQVEKENLRDEFTRVRQEKDTLIADLENTVRNMRARLNDLENYQFDRPDGRIIRVDNTTRRVWINLGSADNLREQVLFSVYIQGYRSVGQEMGKEDIKAAIEVTEIRGPHLAEARILEGTEDASRPIVPEDPIYSPIWTKGEKEYISFVGIVDFDGDGKSDRKRLHDLLANAGAAIEVEIDDEGNRIPPDGKLTSKSRFLVVGDFENPADFSGTSEKQEFIRKISEQDQALEKEALAHGVRTISFRDFKAYMGFEPQQRTFVAGESPRYNLKSGSRSTGTDEVLGTSRYSGGKTSELFNPDRVKNSKSSSGSR